MECDADLDTDNDRSRERRGRQAKRKRVVKIESSSSDDDSKIERTKKGKAPAREEDVPSSVLLAVESSLPNMSIEDIAMRRSTPPLEKHGEETQPSPVLQRGERIPSAIRPPIKGKTLVLEDPPTLGEYDRDGLVTELRSVRAQSRQGKRTSPKPIAGVITEEQLMKMFQTFLSQSGTALPSGTAGGPVPPRLPSAAPRPPAEAVPLAGASKKKKKKKKKNKTGEPLGNTVAPQGTPGSSAAPPGGAARPQAEWITVGKRGRRRKEMAPVASQASLPLKQSQSYADAARLPRAAKTAALAKIVRAQARTGSTGAPGIKRPESGAKQAPVSSQANGKKKPPKPTPAKKIGRVARSAAVTVTCPPDKYGEVMAVAMKKVGDVAALGLPPLRPKRAQNGGIIIEVRGPDNAAKADLLAERIREAVADREKVRIGRPVKMAELRVKDLVDSAAPEEVAAALAEAGGCHPSEVTTGGISKGPNGLGTLWVRCPLAAARKAAATGRMRVSWFEARIELLARRPLQCYKCLQRGHVRQRCPAEEDRSDLCFRCGQPGHLARGCQAAPKCLLCEAAGRPSNHRVGGEACKPSNGPVGKAGGKKKKKAKKGKETRRGGGGTGGGIIPAAPAQVPIPPQANPPKKALPEPSPTAVHMDIDVAGARGPAGSEEEMELEYSATGEAWGPYGAPAPLELDALAPVDEDSLEEGRPGPGYI